MRLMSDKQPIPELPTRLCCAHEVRLQVVIEGMRKVVFKIHIACEPDFASQFVVPFVYCDPVAATRGEYSRRHTRRAAADDLLWRRTLREKLTEIRLPVVW